MICSKPVADRREVRTTTRWERLSVSAGASAEIYGKSRAIRYANLPYNMQQPEKENWPPMKADERG
jgi:hypothetical protein